MNPTFTAALVGLCIMTPAGATPLTSEQPIQRSATLSFDAHGGKKESARFAIKSEQGGLRTYEQTTTLKMREGAPAGITYAEIAGMPLVRSGNLAFDALFAHAVVEMKENSVSAIRDGAYNGGQPLPCDCFETGEKWHYVWTRDLAYAANLGLGMLDPRRVRNSLEFKLSGYRSGVKRTAGVPGSDDGLQIIQDTGSGGSWPVSTDRVSWAFGAEEALHALVPAERAAFAVTVLKALSNTIESDRIAAFDPRDGLYTGEQSFLDWREQSYGAGIADDLARMASAKALSTNVAHYKALTLAAQLAIEQRQQSLAAKYTAWATDLKAAINRHLWLDDAGMYSSLTAAHFDGAPMHKFDWLGQSLAVVTGVADAARAKRILASYPHGPMGAPVIYPQQPGVPIYHNRSIWPFVTAYGLNAATLARNTSVADAAYATLVRGAALHLSNMENMEWLSGAAMFEDENNASLNGPVINSRRQLWSVGAYLGMVVRNIFGIGLDRDGIVIRPFVTARLRREMFGASAQIVLEQLRLRDKVIKVVIALPPASVKDGYLEVESIKVNGSSAGPLVKWDALAANNTIEIRLAASVPGELGITRVADDPGKTAGATFAPHDPVVGGISRTASGAISVYIQDAHNRAGSVVYQIYRNGKLVADRLAATQWIDAAPSANTNCYAVAAQSVVSGNRSHHSEAVCAERGIEITMSDPRVRTNLAVASGRPAHIKAWGGSGDSFAVDMLTLPARARYSIQLKYKNTGHAINTGISNGVKQLLVRDSAGRVVAQRVIQMPHLPPASAPKFSTPADIDLDAGTYSVELSDFYNMSYLASNSVYNAGGGQGGPLNRVDLFGLRVLKLDAE